MHYAATSGISEGHAWVICACGEDFIAYVLWYENNPTHALREMARKLKEHVIDKQTGLVVDVTA